MSVVRIDSVSRFYGNEKALDGVSLAIEERERVVILGPSGCGKTTILRLIAGFLAPDKGSIILDGTLVSGDGRVLIPPEERKLGMVFQDLALWPHLSVEENLSFGLKAKGIARDERIEAIATMLQLVGMQEFARRRPAELSGGQQQRVALARALVLQPRLLLMDEPLSSLDLDLNLRLRQEILRLQEQLGFTMIHVTHDRDEAFELATRVVKMSAGRVEIES